MGNSKFVRSLSAILMILALLAQAAPASGASVPDQDDIHAANVQGSPTNPAVDPQDCIGTPQAVNNGQSRYFITVRSTSGLDITNAVGRIIASPGANVLIPGGGGTVVPFGSSTVTMS